MYIMLISFANIPIYLFSYGTCFGAEMDSYSAHGKPGKVRARCWQGRSGFEGGVFRWIFMTGMPIAGSS
jgi:hypothetical protein